MLRLKKGKKKLHNHKQTKKCASAGVGRSGPQSSTLSSGFNKLIRLFTRISFFYVSSHLWFDPVEKSQV